MSDEMNNTISFEVEFEMQPIRLVDESEYILNEIMYVSLLLQAREAYIKAFKGWFMGNYPLAGEDGFEEGLGRDIERSLSHRSTMEDYVSEDNIRAKIEEKRKMFGGS